MFFPKFKVKIKKKSDFHMKNYKYSQEKEHLGVVWYVSKYFNNRFTMPTFDKINQFQCNQSQSSSFIKETRDSTD